MSFLSISRSRETLESLFIWWENWYFASKPGYNSSVCKGITNYWEKVIELKVISPNQKFETSIRNVTESATNYQPHYSVHSLIRREYSKWRRNGPIRVTSRHELSSTLKIGCVDSFERGDIKAIAVWMIIFSLFFSAIRRSFYHGGQAMYNLSKPNRRQYATVIRAATGNMLAQNGRQSDGCIWFCIHPTGRHWIDLLAQNDQNTRYYKILTFLHGIIPKQSKAERTF